MATRGRGDQEHPKVGPSERLMTVFRACPRVPTEVMEKKLRTFLQHHRDNVGEGNTNDLVEKCCGEARALFYKILDKVVIDKSIIMDTPRFDLFQCCLVACCLEITTFLNHLPCDFPRIVQILNLAPYYFLKVIQQVLLAKVGLPHIVFGHLAQVEEKVLESLAWTSDSPLWEQIRANEGHLPTCQQAMPPEQLEDTERTHSEPDRSRSQGAEPSASTEQQRSLSAASRPQRSSSLFLQFSRKVYSLMSKRLRELCSTLGISKELRLKIWTCFEHSLVHCTDLMVDCHLDQLLMCAIYIIAKNTNEDITLQRIMACYQTQDFSSKSVCENMPPSGGDTENSVTENNNNGDHSASIPTPNTPSSHYPGPCQAERGNLIHFYYQIYTTRMQHFAKQFAPTSGADTPPLSPYPQQRKVSSRTQHLLSNYSINISPLNTETSVPRPSSLCYTFNFSPSEHLREINKMVKMGRPPSRGRYELSFDEEEEEEEEEEEGEGADDGPPARRQRLAGESAIERRARTVVNDRVTTRDQNQDQDKPCPEADNE